MSVPRQLIFRLHYKFQRNATIATFIGTGMPWLAIVLYVNANQKYKIIIKNEKNFLF
jgi:hypothetical protein